MGGTPARQIGKFDELINKRIDCFKPESDPEILWANFYAQRMLNGGKVDVREKLESNIQSN